MFIKHGIPGGQPKIFRDFPRPSKRGAVYTHFYTGFNSYRDVLEFHRKTNDIHAIFEKFRPNASSIDIHVFFLFIFFRLFTFIYVQTAIGRTDDNNCD